MEYFKKQNTMARLDAATNQIKAMAHPMRMAIIDLLTRNKELSVTTIHETLGLEQAVASHHLNIMKDKGILDAHREGKNIYYRLKNKEFSQILRFVKD